jgi:hypothetical protein
MEEFHPPPPTGSQALSTNIPEIQIKTTRDTTTANHRAVTKFRIEYADGSQDEMELLDASQGLYSWDQAPGSQ